MPTVSIVVSCYNQQEFIAETLESVLSQCYSDWECVIVNDGSTDGSQAIIQQYAKKDPRFIPFTKENGGVAAARNFGFAQARGSLFLPLDGDDKLHRQFVRRIVERFDAEPDTVLVHTATQRFGDERKLWRLPSYSYEKMLYQNMIVNTAMFRRDAFERTTGYSSEMVYGLEDWEFYVRLLNPESKVQYIDEPLFFYRIKKGSRSSEHVVQNRSEESRRLIYSRNRDRYAALTDDPIGVFRQRMKEFEPAIRAKYKRRAQYLHAMYGTLIVFLLGALLMRGA